MSLYNSYRYRRNKLTPICLVTAALLLLIYIVNLKSSRTFPAELYKQEENGSPLDSTLELDSKAIKQQPNSMACPRPDLPIDHPDIMQFIEKMDPIKCDQDPDWVVVDGHTASVTKQALEDHGEETSCIFTEWKRIDDNEKVEGATTAGQTFEFTSTDYVTVECIGGDEKTWSNTLYGIRKDIPREGKYPDGGMGINFVALGFDSLSHNMFMRQLPKTYRYLKEELNGKVLNGYNIVGDGTPQAITPMLTGQTELELPEVRRAAANSDYVNSYPMAWKDFKAAGYVTMYWEDTPNINTYNYRLNGFKEQPTDHYARPFYQLVNYDSQPKLCIRSQPRHKTFLDNVHNYMKTYRNRPYFYFSIHGELSHDDINLVSIADEDVLNLLKDLKNENLLDNTLFSLYSDHGNRFQKVRATQQGKQEERMPFVSYIVPQTLKERFPQAYQNLITNLDRLTCPFDIHATLMDILHFTANETGSLSNRKISFFSEIPKERSCQHAGIDPHWCACLAWETLAVTDARAVAAASAFVAHLNALTSPHRELCQALSIQNLHSVGLLLPDNDMMDFVGNADNDGFVPKMGANQQVTVEKYEVKLETQPGSAMYEATLSYDRRTQAFSLKNTDISLITKYGEKSSCILDVDPQLLKYCIC